MPENITKTIISHIKKYPQRLSREENLRLFLGIAFPIHIWTIYQVLNDLEWIAARTQPIDALGYAGYAMGFAMLEAFIIFAVAWLLGMLTPPSFRGKQLVAIFVWSSWGLILPAAVEQILNSLPEDAIPAFVDWLFSTGHPLWFAYPLLIMVWSSIILFTGLPLLAFIRTKNAVLQFNQFLDRINVLTTLFIVMDIAGLIIVIGRNLSY